MCTDIAGCVTERTPAHHNHDTLHCTNTHSLVYLLTYIWTIKKVGHFSSKVRCQITRKK